MKLDREHVNVIHMKNKPNLELSLYPKTTDSDITSAIVVRGMTGAL